MIARGAAGRARVLARRENVPRPKGVIFVCGHNPSSASVTIRRLPDEDAVPPPSTQPIPLKLALPECRWNPAFSLQKSAAHSLKMMFRPSRPLCPLREARSGFAEGGLSSGNDLAG